VWSGSWARSKGSRLIVGQDGWGSWLAGRSGGGAESLGWLSLLSKSGGFRSVELKLQ
jgi:hypothetical protein